MLDICEVTDYPYRRGGIAHIRFLVDSKDVPGEGLLWNPDQDRLYWIDSLGNATHRCDPRGKEVKTWPVPDNIGSIALRKRGADVLEPRFAG